MVPDNPYPETVKIIQSARARAFYKVNGELIGMYLRIGKFVSENSRDAAYGDSCVNGLSDFFAKNYPEPKGFTRPLAGNEERKKESSLMGSEFICAAA